jgi:hypothetical protein
MTTAAAAGRIHLRVGAAGSGAATDEDDEIRLGTAPEAGDGVTVTADGAAACTAATVPELAMGTAPELAAAMCPLCVSEAF